MEGGTRGRKSTSESESERKQKRARARETQIKRVTGVGCHLVGIGCPKDNIQSLSNDNRSYKGGRISNAYADKRENGGGYRPGHEARREKSADSRLTA